AVGADHADAGLGQPSPMHQLPSGVEFGTAVHAVFERIDPTAADLPTALRQAGAVTLAQGPTAEMAVDELVSAMLPAFRTPLGPIAHEFRLCDIPRRDRRAELSFEYPVAGGDTTTADITLGMVGPLLRRHLPPSDPLVGYPDLMDDPSLNPQVLRGYLTGSIDAVLRIRSDNRPPRYLVVDYKTNWLGGFDGEVLKLGHYVPALMAGAMMGAHYPLQGVVERALPASVAALHGRLAPPVAVAAAGLRSRSPSGWRSVPLRTRDGRCGHPAGEGDALRCVRLASVISACD